LAAAFLLRPLSGCLINDGVLNLTRAGNNNICKVSLMEYVQLSASVGGSGAVNREQDVLAIQKLINFGWIFELPSLDFLDETGQIDQATIRAITVFQRDYLKFKRPDGRVDPKGKTLRNLNGSNLRKPSAPEPRKEILLSRPSFEEMMRVYPRPAKGVTHCPKLGANRNQCAVRMSVALQKCGITIEGKYPHQKCGCKKHATGAHSLAQWLYRHPAMGRPIKYSDPVKGKKLMAGRKGLVFFNNCFQRWENGPLDGDHIDLWDGKTTVGFSDPDNNSSYLYFWPLT